MAQYTPWEAFQERVAWQGPLAVACVAVSEAIGAFEAARLERMDVGILSALGMLGEAPSSSEEDPTRLALARVDAKLDMLLEVLNRHLLGRVTLPPVRAVRLNTRGVAIDPFDLPAPDTRVRVELYFDGCAGMPLTLSGFTAATDRPGGRFIRFHALPDPVREGLERLVFRQQRQKLAAARQAGQTSPKRDPEPPPEN